MQKININSENVVIGSHTIPEYKFQVCNFMNMLWDNINRPEDCRCMTIGVVANNLSFEIKRLASELNVSSTIYASKVEELIMAIRVIVRELNSFDVNSKYTLGEQENLKKLANDSWRELLDVLTRTFNLANYTINEKVVV
jgi:hypothetical protein